MQRDSPLPKTCIASSIISIPHWSGTFVTTDEPTLTHQNHPKSIVYIKIHSWCCTFYGFGQMYDGIYQSLQYHIEYFHYHKNQNSTGLKILCVPQIHCPPQLQHIHTQDGTTTDPFTVSINFAFSLSDSWKHTVCSFFILTSFSQ